VRAPGGGGCISATRLEMLRTLITPEACDNCLGGGKLGTSPESYMAKKRWGQEVGVACSAGSGGKGACRAQGVYERKELGMQIELC
jgi:hypothetical protein